MRLPSMLLLALPLFFLVVHAAHHHPQQGHHGLNRLNRRLDHRSGGAHHLSLGLSLSVSVGLPTSTSTSTEAVTTTSSKTSTGLSSSTTSSVSSAPSTTSSPTPSSSSTAASTSLSSLTTATISASSSPSTTSTGASSPSSSGPPSSTPALTITGTGTLPKPTSFVQRRHHGQHLHLEGENYRIVGPNIYWLCSDENDDPWAAPPAKSRVREALAMAVAMGANTIRAHTCGISVGPNSPYNLHPSPGVWNESLWDIRDYVLFAAREYGLRVILPLTDNYDYYHGGKYSFLDFFKISRANAGEAFYTSPIVIRAYKDYITRFLLRVNRYTGVAYQRDPTILAWETGNELGGYINEEMWPPVEWTDQITHHIRKYDHKHLVIDGTNGFWNYTTKVSAPSLNLSSTDLVSDHGAGYPRNVALLEKEVELAGAAGKGFLIGEYDWTSNDDKDSLADFLATIESAGSYLGDMLWSLLSHSSSCTSWITHSDNYSLYYPLGNSLAADRANVEAVVRHWYRVTGREEPEAGGMVEVRCPQEEF
ncbi:hypothetical protein JCM6882_001106 [Rhodosporidiobolus microsporus]